MTARSSVSSGVWRLRQGGRKPESWRGRRVEERLNTFAKWKKCVMPGGAQTDVCSETLGVRDKKRYIIDFIGAKVLRICAKLTRWREWEIKRWSAELVWNRRREKQVRVRFGGWKGSRQALVQGCFPSLEINVKNGPPAPWALKYWTEWEIECRGTSQI